MITSLLRRSDIAKSFSRCVPISYTLRMRVFACSPTVERLAPTPNKTTQSLFGSISRTIGIRDLDGLAPAFIVPTGFCWMAGSHSSVGAHIWPQLDKIWIRWIWLRKVTFNGERGGWRHDDQNAGYWQPSKFITESLSISDAHDGITITARKRFPQLAGNPPVTSGSPGKFSENRRRFSS